MMLLTACSFDAVGTRAGGSSDADAAVEPRPDANTTDPSVDAAQPGTDAAGPQSDAPPGATAFRKAITIPGTGSERLDDFPLYVALIDDSDLRDRALPDASDVFFTGADGVTALDYEIEQWDPAAGTLLAWVRVPALDDAAATTLYVRYGDAEVAAPPDATGVWQNDFLAVFHMNDDPTGPITDSTGARDGIGHSSMTTSDLVDAKLGRGIALDGGNDVIEFDNPYAGGGSHTISGWVQQNPSTNNEAFVVLGTGGTTDASRFIHTRFFGGPIAVGLYTDDFVTSEDIQGDGFTLVHWTYDDAGRSRVYVDGVRIGGPHTHAGIANTAGSEGRIGNAPGGTGGFGTSMGLSGIVDEVRLVSSSRSDAWIAAEFANQSAPDTFYTVGAEEAVAP